MGRLKSSANFMVLPFFVAFVLAIGGDRPTPIDPHESAGGGRSLDLTGKARLGHRPSKKSIRRMVENVHDLTDRAVTWQETTELVGRLNRALRRLPNYFSVGTVNKAYRTIDNYTAVRLRRRWRIKHNVRRRKGGTYPLPHLYGHFGLVRLCRLGHDVPWVKAGSFVREPDGGDLHVRVDEKAVETEPWRNH